jgi:NADH-quinone oxidoreductase subunit M
MSLDVRTQLRLAAPLLAISAALAMTSATPREASAHAGHGKPAPIQLGPKLDAVPPPGPRGRVAVDTPTLKLLRGEGTRYVAELRVRNVGDGPLRILRVGLPTGGPWPDAPPGLGVQALERDAPIPPGGTRTYEVGWRAEAARAEQLHARIQVESDSAAPGATSFDPPAEARIWADRRLGPARYLLSIVLGLPLLLPLLALVASRLPALGERMLRRAATGVAAAHAAAAGWAFARFDRELGRADGNEGLQMIERAKLGALDYFVALDGISAACLAALALAGFASIAALEPAARGGERRIAALGVLLSGVSLGLVAQTPALSVVGFVAAAAAAFVVVHGASALAARRLAPALAVSVAGAALSGHLLAHHAPSEAGALVASFAEIVRDGLHLHDGHEHWLGVPVARAAWAATLAAALPLLGVLPFGGWLAALQRDVAPGVTSLVAAALGLLGGSYLVRVGLLALPGEAAWAAPALAAFALVTMLLGALAALGDREPMRLVGKLGSIGGALVLLAVASRTPQGLQAAVLLLAVRGLALPLLVLTAASFAARLGALADGPGGVLQTAPKLAAAWVLALLAASGLPGGAAYWGALEALVGVLARTPAVGVVAALAVTLGAAAHLRGVGRASASPDPRWRASDRLAAHGGKVPDLFHRELAWVLPLGAALLALAFFPRAVSSTTDTLVIDAQPALDPPGPTQIG